MNLSYDLQLAITAAQKAGEIIKEDFGKVLTIEQKEKDKGIVTEVDKKAEKVTNLQSWFGNKRKHKHFMKRLGLLSSPNLSKDMVSSMSTWNIDREQIKNLIPLHILFLYDTVKIVKQFGRSEI